MELVKQIETILKQAEAQSLRTQDHTIKQASRVFDELVTKGLIDPPSYRLTPINAVPPKTLAFYKQR